MTSPRAITAEDPGPRLNGVFDLPRPDRLAGWAIDRASEAAAVEVEIRREGRLIATERADRHRADLARGGVGTGNYGFAVTLDPPIEPGFEFTLSVTAKAADGASAPLRRGARPEAGSERRLLERVFEEVLRAGSPAPADPEGLSALLERIELTQHRLESALAALPPPAREVPHRDLRRILVATLTIALGGLGLGLYSLFLT